MLIGFQKISYFKQVELSMSEDMMQLSVMEINKYKKIQKGDADKTIMLGITHNQWKDVKEIAHSTHYSLIKN